MADEPVGTAELRAAAREFLRERAPVSSLREVVDGTGAAAELGHVPGTWHELAHDLQLLAVAIPEEFGGLGLGQDAACAVGEELGAVLYSGPARSTALAAQALLLGRRDDRSAGWLAAIAAGRLRATVALPPGGPRDAHPLEARAGGDDHLTLTGELRLVPDGMLADLIIVPVATPGGACLAALEPSSALTRAPVTAADLTHRYANVRLEAASALRLTGPAAADTVTRLVDLGALAVAAEQVGGAWRCLELAVEYACLREQFGRRIGSYQAIQHRCADLAVEIEAARLLVQRAASLAGADHGAFGRVVPLARAESSAAFVHAAEALIQIHGGIGITWEHDAHLFFRRARASAAWFGTPRQWREEFVARRDAGQLVA